MKSQATRNNIEEVYRTQLKKMGCRCTPERLHMLHAVMSMPSLFEFDTLSDYIDSNSDFPLSRSTIFNGINQFIQLGLLQKHYLRDKVLYQFCAKPHEPQCIAVCSDCGAVNPVMAKSIISAIPHINTHGFVVERSTLYLWGVCAKCNKKRMKKQKAEARRS